MAYRSCLFFVRACALACVSLGCLLLFWLLLVCCNVLSVLCLVLCFCFVALAVRVDVVFVSVFPAGARGMLESLWIFALGVGGSGLLICGLAFPFLFVF